MSPDKEREADALRHTTERLRLQFPDRSSNEIDSAVNDRYSDFDSAVIRDFVPVLVERSVRNRLAAQRSA
jgi:hypothetical protein